MSIAGKMLHAAHQAEASVARMQSEPEGRLKVTAEVPGQVDLVEEEIDLAVRIAARPAPWDAAHAGGPEAA